MFCSLGWSMGSHTTTGEWQSFEARMRRRRAERLALRADIAVEAGCPDEARACLEEARRLAPALPECARVEQKLRHGTPEASASTPTPVAVASAFSRKHLMSAAAVPLLVAAGAVTLGGANPIRPTREFRSLTNLVSADPPVTAIFRLKAETTGGVVAQATKRELAEATGAGSAVSVASAFTPRSENPPAPAPILSPIRPIELEAPAALTPGPGSDQGQTGVRPFTSVSRPSVPAEPSDDIRVRSTLDRYAAAYSALDADAAQSVWPRVNRGALTRAFETLASQQVSLGDCRVDVTGASARATCAGSATWAPKVGTGSSRTDPRRWDFELANTGAGWQIVSARVQNR
jgi:hypothetical protein